MSRPFGTNLLTMMGLIIFVIMVRSVAPDRTTPGEEAANPPSPDEVTEQHPASRDGTAAMTSAPDNQPLHGSRSVTPSFGDPIDPTTLERVEPRAPLSSIAKAKEPEKPEITRLFRPIATAAGRVEVQGHEIVIAGIEVVDVARECDGPGGAWPCGMRARTAFRSFLRGRALDCKLPEEEGEDPVAASCTLADQDVGEWLVANGWALAADAGPYVDIARTARDQKRGIFGDGARGPTP
ncbi:MAG TPA: thermonuclease family protein [Rhizobiaceae bacterium]|nr:thermonuclease family protein [Rhizobiaceae bacterium]